MKLPQEFLEAAHQEEVEEIMERGVKLGHFERKIDRRGVKSYRITPWARLGSPERLASRIERQPTAHKGNSGQ
jgi:hypothetical protein